MVAQGLTSPIIFSIPKVSYSNTITLDNDRVFRFKSMQRTLTIKTGLYPYTAYDRINVNLDFDQLEFYGCKFNTITIFSV